MDGYADVRADQRPRGGSGWCRQQRRRRPVVESSLNGLEDKGKRRVEIGPAVADAGGEITIDEKLDLDLIQAALAIAGLDIDDAELVVEKFALVVGVEDVDLADRRGGDPSRAWR